MQMNKERKSVRMYVCKCNVCMKCRDWNGSLNFEERSQRRRVIDAMQDSQVNLYSEKNREADYTIIYVMYQIT